MQKELKNNTIKLLFTSSVVCVFACLCYSTTAVAAAVWTDEFTSYNSRWDWSYYSGTGYHQITTVDSVSAVEIGITDQSSSASYSDCSLHETSYLYTTGIFEARLRCTDDNGFNQPGKGTRGWGVWNYQNPSYTDAAWFWSASPDSDASVAGLHAMLVIDSNIVFQEPLPGIDITQWHVYRVEFLSTGTRFFVDGIEVAFTPLHSVKLQRFELWIDNYVVQVVGGIPQPVGFLDVGQNQMMYIDWVTYYDGTSVQNTPIPAVSECGMIILFILLIGLGLLIMRKRTEKESA